MMQVVLQEESLRDGLQSEDRLLSLTEKLELVRLLVVAGVRRLQVGSFVNPRSVPHVANTDTLAAMVRRQYPDLLCSALVRNEKGLERARRSGLDRVSVTVPVSDTESRKHTGRPAVEQLEAKTRLIHTAAAAGVTVQAGVRCAFGCVYEGEVPTSVVLDTIAHLVAAGAAGINLADTAGLAHPRQVQHLVGLVRTAHPDIELALHLHDTRGLGLVNLYAGYEAGVRVFDSAAGGLGDCPFVDGAPGNVATEDAVHLFQTMGIETGIDLTAFCRVVNTFATLFDRPLPGRFCRTLHGPSTETNNLR
jgi:hydroxymethylglutaryl-CoA lyase